MQNKFFSNSVKDEIYQSMEKQLVANQTEDRLGIKKLARAAEYLISAAQVFEQAGMTEQVKEIAEVLQELAQDIGSK